MIIMLFLNSQTITKLDRARQNALKVKDI